jgi:glycosyltransferase involved in cell wall biosynthesis
MKIPQAVDGAYNGLSIIVPVFNEQEAIPLFYSEALKELKAVCAKMPIEFIFVDDGSTDNTCKILKDLQAKDPRVHFISFSRNFGQDSAILCGMEHADGEYAVVMDVDLQHPPALIPKMLEVVESGDFDCADTRRINRKGEGAIRNICSNIFYYMLSKMTGIKVISGMMSFRVMNRKYMDAVLAMREQCRVSKFLFSWVGFKVKTFEYENIERVAGQSSWPIRKLFAYAITSFIGFSQKPLDIALYFSVFSGLISVLWAVFLIIKYFLYYSIEGWQILAFIVLALGSSLFFCLAILGAYIAKIFIHSQNRPQYLIRDIK